jgi:hypothetical protein
VGTGSDQPWERLRDARSAYSGILASMLSTGIWDEQLRRALAAPRGRASALRILLEGPVERVMDLVDAVLCAALSAGPDTEEWELARTALAGVDPGWLALALPGLLTEQVDAQRCSGADRHRAATLLRQLEQTAALEGTSWVENP